MTAAVDRWLDRLKAGETIVDPEADVWLMATLATLKASRQENARRHAEAARERDERVQRLREMLWCGDTTTTAEQIAEAAQHYAVESWAGRDEFLPHCPAAYEGKPEAEFYGLHRIRTYRLQWPLRWRRLYDLIADDSRCRTLHE